jgi:tetratricopeptide (TPR) repeat protein
MGAPADGLLRVDLRLLDASTGEVVQESGATGTPHQIFELIERAGNTLRIAAGVRKLSASEALTVQATWPSDPEAARLFASGLQSLRRSDAANARETLQQAADIETNHPLILAKLAEALRNLGYEQLATEKIAIARNNASGLPDSIRRSIDASFFELNHETNRAIAIYQDLYDSHPDDIDTGLRLTSSQIQVSATREAGATLERMTEMSGGEKRDPRLHLMSSVILSREGDLEGALADARAAIEAADSVDSKFLAATGRTRAAEILHQLGDVDQAESLLTEAQQIFESVDNLSGQAETLEASAQLAHHRGDLAVAQHLQNRALEIYEGMGNLEGAARTRHNLGVIAIDQGDLVGAETLFEQALATYRKIGALAEAAASELDLGVALHLAGELSGAEKRYRSALDLYTGAKDNPGTALALTNLGEILFLRGDIASSRELHQEALALNTEIGDPSAMAYDTYRLGEVFLAAGDLIVARSRFDSALATQQELGEAISVALTQLSLARLELVEGRYPRAAELARSAEEVLRVEGAIDLAGLAQAVLADVMLATGDRESAVDLAERAKAAADTSSDHLLKLTAAMAWSRVIAVTDLRHQQAVSTLQKVVADANTGGYLQVRLEAQLALAEVDLAAGDLEKGRQVLQQVIGAAEERGLGLILRRAKAFLPKA